jgi:Tfp pilus assembly protein PilO
MSKTRLWVLGALALMLVVVVGGWTLGISPVFSQISAADTQLAATQSSTQSSQAQLATLKVQYASISKFKKKLNALRLSIPETQSASVFINELSALGASSGVSLQNVTLASATLYAAAAPDTTAPANSTNTTATPAPTATAAATGTTPPAATTTTSSGLVLIPVTITITGPLEATRLFTGAVQTGSRLFLVSNVNYSVTGGISDTTITGDIFTLKGTSDPSPKAKLVPTPTPTATPTATPTPTPTPTATKAAAKSGTTGGSTTATVTSPAPTASPTPSPSPSS